MSSEYNSRAQRDKLNELISKANKHPTRNQFIIGIDPGETTGVCAIWHQSLRAHTHEQFQTKTIEQAFNNLHDWLTETRRSIPAPLEIVAVIEEYRVFSWKTDQHSFASLHTPQLIGALRWHFHRFGERVILQTPQNAKNFWTDKKLKQFGFYLEGNPHARDAARHALYYAVFGGKSI